MATIVFKSLTDGRPIMVGVRKAAHILSTEAEDRDGDVVSLSGWSLDSYRKNPVVLWAHDLKQPPIGRAEDVAVRKGALRSVTVFPDPGVYAVADTVAGLTAGGFLKGVSVGFHPITAEPRRTKGIHFHKAELYEYSLLPIPSNREALTEAAQVKGLRLDLVLPAFEALADGGQGYGVPDEERRLVQKALSHSASRSTVRFGGSTRGLATIEKSQADVLIAKLREGARTVAAEALRRSGGRIEAAEAAVAAFREQAIPALASEKASADARTLEQTTVAFVGGARVSAADVVREVEAQVHSYARDVRDIRAGRGPGGEPHKAGELSADDIAKLSKW